MPIEAGWWLYTPPDDIKLAPVGYDVVIHVQISGVGNWVFNCYFIAGVDPREPPDSQGIRCGTSEIDPVVFEDLRLHDPEEFRPSDFERLVAAGRITQIENP